MSIFNCKCYVKALSSPPPKKGLIFVLHIDLKWLLRIVCSPLIVNAAVSLQCSRVSNAVGCCSSGTNVPCRLVLFFY